MKVALLADSGYDTRGQMFERRLWRIPPSEQWQRKQDEPRLHRLTEWRWIKLTALPALFPGGAALLLLRDYHMITEYETCPQPHTHAQGLILL